MKSLSSIAAVLALLATVVLTQSSSSGGSMNSGSSSSGSHAIDSSGSASSGYSSSSISSHPISSSIGSHATSHGDSVSSSSHATSSSSSSNHGTSHSGSAISAGNVTDASSSSSGSGSNATAVLVNNGISALDYLISTSYSLTAADMNCFNDNPTEFMCNNTIQCYWDNSTFPPACQLKDNVTGLTNATVDTINSWCFGHFPTPVIATIYMVAAFVLGFAVSGTIYNALWYDTYSRVNDVGERQFNQFYFATAPMNVYCICIVLICILMFFFTFLNQFWDNTSCVYVWLTYAFIIGFFIPAVVIPLWIFFVWVARKCRAPPKTELTLDEWCVPLTKTCLADKRNCQTRCF